MPQAGENRLMNLYPETPDRSGRFSRHTERDSADSISASGEAAAKAVRALGEYGSFEERSTVDRFAVDGRPRGALASRGRP